MNNQNQKSQFTPLTYILIGIALTLAYLLYFSNSSPNDCKIKFAQYVRVYAGPDIKYDVMTVLGEGDRLTLSSGKTTDWHIWQEVITDDGIKGWAAENWETKCK
ncbi:MAG: hypothetical protein HY869_17445 [Chloroflexi bacterium]|nr:hypothetical protein [Chloroflexota bacterium]